MAARLQYVVQEAEGGGHKYSCKGVHKVRLMQASDVYENYKNVLTFGQVFKITPRWGFDTLDIRLTRTVCEKILELFVC